MFHAIRRLVGKAGSVQLIEVHRAATQFVNSTAPLVQAVINRSRHQGGSEDGRLNGNGQGFVNRDDEIGEIDTSEVSGDDVLRDLLSAAQDEEAIRQSVSSGHEAEMERDDSSDGEEHDPSLSEVRQG